MFLAIPTVATKPPVHHAAHGARRCRRDENVRSHPTPRASESTQPPLTRWLYASRAIADKEAVEARQIQLALREAFDEIDDDGGCELAPPHAPSTTVPHPCISSSPCNSNHRSDATEARLIKRSSSRCLQPKALRRTFKTLTI